MADSHIIPDNVKLTETHEYLRIDDDDRARVGISHFAAEQLGDIVFIELPEVGQRIEKGDTFGSIESVKAASDLYMPVSAEVVAVNTQLTEEPELINDNSYGDGWMIEISLTNPEEVNELMTPLQYSQIAQ